MDMFKTEQGDDNMEKDTASPMTPLECANCSHFFTQTRCKRELIYNLKDHQVEVAEHHDIARFGPACSQRIVKVQIALKDVFKCSTTTEQLSLCSECFTIFSKLYESYLEFGAIRAANSKLAIIERGRALPTLSCSSGGSNGNTSHASSKLPSSAYDRQTNNSSNIKTNINSDKESSSSYSPKVLFNNPITKSQSRSQFFSQIKNKNERVSPAVDELGSSFIVSNEGVVYRGLNVETAQVPATSQSNSHSQVTTEPYNDFLSFASTDEDDDDNNDNDNLNDDSFINVSQPHCTFNPTLKPQSGILKQPTAVFPYDSDLLNANVTGASSSSSMFLGSQETTSSERSMTATSCFKELPDPDGENNNNYATTTTSASSQPFIHPSTTELKKIQKTATSATTTPVKARKNKAKLFGQRRKNKSKQIIEKLIKSASSSLTARAENANQAASSSSGNSSNDENKSATNGNNNLKQKRKPREPRKLIIKSASNTPAESSSVSHPNDDQQQQQQQQHIINNLIADRENKPSASPQPSSKQSPKTFRTSKNASSLENVEAAGQKNKDAGSTKQKRKPKKPQKLVIDSSITASPCPSDDHQLQQRQQQQQLLNTVEMKIGNTVSAIPVTVCEKPKSRRGVRNKQEREALDKKTAAAAKVPKVLKEKRVSVVKRVRKSKTPATTSTPVATSTPTAIEGLEGVVKSRRGRRKKSLVPEATMGSSPASSPNVCSTCNVSFANPYNALRHAYITHQMDGWKAPYICSNCNQEFKLKEPFFRHKHHGYTACSIGYSIPKNNASTVATTTPASTLTENVIANAPSVPGPSKISSKPDENKTITTPMEAPRDVAFAGEPVTTTTMTMTSVVAIGTETRGRKRGGSKVNDVILIEPRTRAGHKRMRTLTSSASGEDENRVQTRARAQSHL